MLRSIDRGVVLVTSGIVVMLMVAMTGAILAGVFARYVMNDALAWSEEVARYALVWLSFLGGGLVFRHGGHVSIDFLVNKLAGPPRWLVVGCATLASATFLAVLAWQGYTLMERGAYQTSPALRLPMTVPYAAIPVGAGLMLYHMAVLGLEAAIGRRRTEPAPAGLVDGAE